MASMAPVWAHSLVVAADGGIAATAETDLCRLHFELRVYRDGRVGGSQSKS